MSMTREALMRYLDSRYRQEMLPARVVGSANGVVTVEINGETQIMNHHGPEDLTPGTLIWARPNAQGSTSPLNSLEFSGARNQGGTINDQEPTTRLQVHGDALGSILGPILDRLDALEEALFGPLIVYNGVDMPRRRVIRFQGNLVTVVDNAIDDVTVVTISDGTFDAGYNDGGSYNDGLGYNE